MTAPQRQLPPTKPDDRIIGRWAMRDSYGQLLTVWEYKEDGTHIFTDPASDYRRTSGYSVAGDVIHYDGSEAFVILSSTRDSLVVREVRPHEDVEPFTIKLTRLPE
ncbi:hypothetical protein AYO47_00270 [Planctomyces sp. SCGC AG-212-M04]|nr:hypothetical protein AYO47_00270 [Planctomyces sp. SCGC AG-212-M04]